MIRAIIFDLDGTLGNTLPVVFAALNRVFERYTGRTYTDDEITLMFGPSEEGIIRRRVEDHGPAHQYFLEEYDRAHVDLCTGPFPGIERLLEALRERGVKLAIVTGKGPRSAEISLRHLGIERFFDAIRAGYAEGDRKPETMRELVDHWKLAPEEAAYVGDSCSDMASARSVGVKAVAAAWAETANADDLAACSPDELFTSVDAFEEWARTSL